MSLFPSPRLTSLSTLLTLSPSAASVILNRLWRRTFWAFKITRRQEGLYVIVSHSTFFCLLSRTRNHSLTSPLSLLSNLAKRSERVFTIHGSLRSHLDLLHRLHLEALRRRGGSAAVQHRRFQHVRVAASLVGSFHGRLGILLHSSRSSRSRRALRREEREESFREKAKLETQVASIPVFLQTYPH